MPENPLVRLIPGLARCRYEVAPDGELVAAYAGARDEAAFAELVRRHGPMVLAVCRRVVRNRADADDVFQATFMVLARKAASIRPAGSVGPWLHGVAYRTALEALRRAARRRAKEGRVVPRETVSDDQWSDLRPVLDAELDRLPRKYAEVLVLCDMEDRPRRDVAALLGVPEGTVASRLARAREALAARLARRGVGASAAVAAGALSADARAAIPPEVVADTTRVATAFGAGQAAGFTSAAALELANAIVRTATLRFKLLVAGFVVAAATVTGWAAIARPGPRHDGPAAGPTGHDPQPAPAPAALASATDPAAALRQKLAGLWQVESGTRDNRPLTAWERQGFRLGFDATGVLTVHRGQLRGQRTFIWAVDRAAAPPALVLTPTDGNPAGVVRVPFELKDNSLSVTWPDASGQRGRGPQVDSRLTLVRLAPAPGGPAEVAVALSTQNVVGARLSGTWEADDEWNHRLGLPARPEGAAKTLLTFTGDPAVAAAVPAGYRAMFAEKRVYLAGRMTLARAGGEPASYRFLLTEHDGTPLLVYFVPQKWDEWACEEAATVALVPAADRERDLLFLTAFESAPNTPTGGFRRAAAKQ
jgi:RNA polymerase sigma factor (sigma-70 family)